jgi:hypothetical protein
MALVFPDVSGGGGIGSAASVAIFQPAGVRTHSTIIKKGFAMNVKMLEHRSVSLRGADKRNSDNRRGFK